MNDKKKNQIDSSTRITKIAAIVAAVIFIAGTFSFYIHRAEAKNQQESESSSYCEECENEDETTSTQAAKN